MAYMNPIRKRIWRIYLVAALLFVCCCLLVACNNDTSYNVSGDVSEPTHFMAKLMYKLGETDGLKNASFGWTVVVFTIILRLILSPLDIWQKLIARKNSKAMERMRPQLEALNEKYGDDKQRLQQEQMALYKKEHYSMLGMCLPTIITFVVFFVVFAGFRQMVGYQYAKDYKTSAEAFNTVVAQEIDAYGYGDRNGDGIKDLADIDPTDADVVKIKTRIIDKAQSAVLETYRSEEQTNIRGWLWIKNIFVSDNWSQEVPDYAKITGQSGFATSRLSGIEKSEYELVMGKVLGTGGYGKEGKWNGLLILPALSLLLSFLSTFLLNKSQAQPPQPVQKDANGQAQPNQANSMKMMQWIMPIMMGVFSLLYSGAFALYMFTSSAAAILFQLTFNLIAKLVDMSRERKVPSNVAKR